LKTLAVTVASDVGDYTMEVVEGDHFGRILEESHRPYEEELLRLGVALTSKGDHVVDVGAHLGNHSIYWALAGRKVTAFEPNKLVAEVLRSNVERNGLTSAVDIRVAALGEARAWGTVRQVDPTNLGSAMVEVGEGDVPIYALDEADLRPFALLKIDVEGRESAVLRGATTAIDRWRPFIIAEALSDGGDTGSLLAAVGYRRLPLSLAFTPTYLYSPSNLAAARALSTRPLRHMAGRLLRGRAVRALRRR
jgi:FkbM family methyltransferase